MTSSSGAVARDFCWFPQPCANTRCSASERDEVGRLTEVEEKAHEFTVVADSEQTDSATERDRGLPYRTPGARRLDSVTAIHGLARTITSATTVQSWE